MRNDLSLFFTKYIFGSNVRSFKCDYVSNWVIMIVINIKKKKSWKRVRMWLMGRLNLTPGLRVLTWVGNGNTFTYTGNVICTLHYEFIIWYIWKCGRLKLKQESRKLQMEKVTSDPHLFRLLITSCQRRALHA